VKWVLQIPILVATRDDDGVIEQTDQQTAPLSVRSAIAEVMWGLGQALSRTTDSISVSAEIEADETLGNGGTKRA